MVSWGRHSSSADLREVVAALDGAHLAYRWFLSDIEANRIGVEASLPVELQLDAAGDTADCWLSGARLDEIANQYDFQLIWGVLSAFHPEAVPERTNPEPRPIAEGHSPTGMIQHPDAQIEIIAFDSTFTAIYGSGHRGRSRLRAVLLAGRRVGDDLDAARLCERGLA